MMKGISFPGLEFILPFQVKGRRLLEVVEPTRVQGGVKAGKFHGATQAVPVFPRCDDHITLIQVQGQAGTPSYYMPNLKKKEASPIF